jgi:hypothetical protein
VPNIDPRDLPHLQVAGTASTELYRAPGRGPRLRTPERTRQSHARHLLGQFRSVKQEYTALSEERAEFGFDPQAGLTLLFESAPDFDLKFESLDLRAKGIQLLSVRQTEDKTVAICYVPDGKLEHFIKRIEEYRTQETQRGVPKNRNLVESIELVRIAAVDALWTDREPLPADDESAWWEIWLRTDDESLLPDLRRAAQINGFTLSDEKLRFPERIVVSVNCTKRQISRSLRLINSIAELRRAKATAADFLSLSPRDQHTLTEELLSRVSVTVGTAAAACMLDTGVTQGHPLLAPSLRPDDCQSVKVEWGPDDPHGHGTEMSGLVLYGNLVEVLSNQDPIELEHHLESVKIINFSDPNPPHLYGAVTIRSVQLAEQAAPDRARAIGMAVTASGDEGGQPSTWSAAIDSLTSGYEDDRRRLMLISAGNTPREGWHHHPAGCQAASVADPGQAWNALTIGACTDLTSLPPEQYPDWRVVAAQGDVSPYSRTSCNWHRPWPIKPEIVLEGGNCAIDPTDGMAHEADELSLLTTHRNPTERPFSLLMMTSAATALAVRDAAILQSRYPDFWPETIRGLLVHSAEWTESMRNHFEPLNTREQKEKILRYCGYGVPDFRRACWSAGNHLTLIAQDSFQPYDKEGSAYKTKGINYHALPWPTDVLRGLRNTPVKLRVTLSYFIEPNPARRGWKGRYRYASHALRFEVKTPTETETDFKSRVNLAARVEEEEGQEYQGDAADWELGPQLRHLGSVHSDWWRGTASALANRNMIAVYPVVGWWRERHHLGRWNRHARYSLIVTIQTPSEEVDIYTPVQTQIAAMVPIEIPTDEE